MAAPPTHPSTHLPTHPPARPPARPPRPPAVEERSFHGGSRHLALLIALLYCIWLLVVRRNYGKVSLAC
jgi:hypothetical protein